MEKVTLENGGVSIEINDNIYSYDCVMKTKQMFEEISEVSVEKTDNGIRVILKPKSKEIDARQLGYEFYNHMLNTIKQMNLGL